MTSKQILEVFRSAIFAGICIGLAGFGFLVNKPIGMFLFIFGLATVVSYKLKLFTGTAGFVKTNKDFVDLFIILIGNIIGCLCVALIARCSPMYLTISTAAINVLSSRMSVTPTMNFVLSIGCGILMTTAVTFARKGKEFGNWLPLMLAVPLFIHCGFPHCIADAFYYLCIPNLALLDSPVTICSILWNYIGIVLGNFVGCNLYRIFIKNDID